MQSTGGQNPGSCDGRLESMNTFCAVVSYHRRRNCFGYLRQSSPAQLQAASTSLAAYNVISCKNPKICAIIKIFTPDGCFYSSQILLLNKKFADLLNFEENEEVIVERVERLPCCSSFEVELLSADDWNIVQNASHRIEKLFLDQLQLITVGHTYPVWVTQNVFIYFTVVRSDAYSNVNGAAFLTSSTEVHIKPFRPVHVDQIEKINLENDLEALPALFNHKIKAMCYGDGTSSSVCRIQNYFADVSKRMTARVLPEILCCNASLEKLSIIAVFRLNQGGEKSEQITISAVSNYGTGQITCALHIELARNYDRFAELIDCLKQYDLRHCAFSPALYRFMNAEYQWIKISPLPKDHIHQIKNLEILLEEDLPKDFDGHLRNYFWENYRHYPIIVPFDGLKIELDLPDKMRVNIILRPHLINSEKKEFMTTECYFFTNSLFPVIHYNNNKSVKDDHDSGTTVTENGRAAINYGGWKNEAVEFAFQSASVEKCYEYIMYHLEKPTFSSSENILIVGDKSSGKTMLIHLLAQKLLHSHLAVYSECVFCTKWAGKSVEKFEEVIKAAVVRLKYRHPSVLFLDNLDFFSRVRDEELRNVRLERFAELLRDLVNKNELLIVATTCSKREIIELFSMSSHGRFFGHIESIEEIKLAERKHCLKQFCELETEICDLQNAANNTEKCTIGDLKRLARRIALEAKAKGREIVQEDDIQQALIGFRPAAFPIQHSKPVELVKLKWEDVGGLNNVKKTLTEVFIWPTKYPQLYRNSSIGLGKGVLLYGRSGCGKTLICKILAAQCGFNIISVKGPELLSRYVGESEENVRNTFERARATSPCLIFFDEFDSLGPKRGDGDTGVTDRVVNQLLTELDGVEGREGVYVLAATNRLDLIDNALLRPGRFDYIVKCELPKKEDRESILRILCRDVRLEEDVNLEAIASVTDDWTGADLKGLVTNAQLIAYKLKKGSAPGEDKDLDENVEFTVTQADFLTAVKDSEPKKSKYVEPEKKLHKSAWMLTTLA